MGEVVAIEYRERDWETEEQMVERVSEVADSFAEAGLAGVELPGLLCGVVEAPSWATKPAVLFGLRAETAQGVVAFGAALSLRGYSGIYTWAIDVDEGDGRREAESILLGFGLVCARGGNREVYDRSPAEIRAMLKTSECSNGERGPQIWMPAPDRFGRAIDGLFVEELVRAKADWIWVPGTGINRRTVTHRSQGHPFVIEARRDDGQLKAGELVRWAEGDRLERGKARLAEVAHMPGRWLRELTGWREK